jgi:hypothetical protein
MTLAPVLRLAPLRVSVDAASMAAYRRETGFEGAADSAPLSYPALWLTTPQIYDAIQRICAEAESVPVHEQQRFFYEAPLRPGAAYDLHVLLRRDDKPPRLLIEARVEALSGALIGRIETLLRLVPRSLLNKSEGV